jgi:hypothetical protein
MVESPDLIEISGMAASRSQDGVIWAHNDSGDSPRVFAMRHDGSSIAAFSLEGAGAVDWEDMAIGRGPEDGVDYLYLGDIGDNAAARENIVVYRVAEPAVAGASGEQPLAGVDAIRLTYPDGAHDAETLMVDPDDGSLVIVSKDFGTGRSGVYRTDARVAGSATAVLEKVADIDFNTLRPQREIPPDASPLVLGAGHIPTGGDMSADGRLIAIRTYATVWLWDRSDGASLAETFASAPCEALSTIEGQGEAIAFEGDGGGYVTASEGANVAMWGFVFR